jgi:hypothetical protein
MLIDNLMKDGFAAFVCVLLAGQGAIQSAPIPGLFNTGVNDKGIPLADNTVELHYKLVDPSPMAVTPVVTTSSGGFPIGPWLADNTNSAWITPANDSNGPGMEDGSANYYYELTFDLTGLDSSTAAIQGNWSTDNAGKDIWINGVATGQANNNQFGSWTPFQITGGFVEGKNTLTFVVNNGQGADDGSGPTGLRVEMSGTAIPPGTPPSVTTQPRSQTVPVGDTVVFSADAIGSAPFAYQWRFNGSAMAGFTHRTTADPGLTNVQTNQAGLYDVVIRNTSGSVTSQVANLTVLSKRIPGLYATGVDSQGTVLADQSPDPHYALVANPDSGATEPVLEDTTAFPISTGTWLAANANSAWIGPLFSTTAAAGGVYIYKTTFDMTGLDPTSAILLGSWAADNDGANSATDILLNGVPLGFKIAPFNSLTDFTITNSALVNFFPGQNTLEFRVENLDVGYTGLRVENLRGGANPGTVAGQLKLGLGFFNGLELGGFVGRTYAIEYIENAADTNWLVLTNLVLPIDPHFFVDPASTNKPNRLYRATLKP